MIRRKGLYRYVQFFFELDDYVSCLLNTSLGQEVANRFRHMQANEEYIKPRQGPNSKSHTPAIDRNEEIGNASGDDPAQPSKAFQENDKAATYAGRRILRYKRCCYRQFTAQTKANEKAKT